MLKCVKTKEICPRNNKRCKVCKHDTCQGVIQMLEIQEKNINRELKNKLIKNLPEHCKRCSFLEVIDLKNKKVKCFYLVKDECLIGGYKK